MLRITDGEARPLDHGREEPTECTVLLAEMGFQFGARPAAIRVRTGSGKPGGDDDGDLARLA